LVTTGGSSLEQVQLGLFRPSQQTTRPYWHPHTPPWCEQQPCCARISGVAPDCFSWSQACRWDSTEGV